MPFHKSCYTSRCSGYKYRTLSTNTGPGEKKSRRPSVQQESLIDEKLNNLHEGIAMLIGTELEDTDRSRGAIFEKIEKIEAKINSMVELRDKVLSMRESLNAAENTLGVLYMKVQKIEVMNEVNSVKTKLNNQKTARALAVEEAEREIYSSDIVTPHILAV